MSRTPHAHVAALLWTDPDADERGPGGAVTEELCGALDHEPPCPVAAHFTSVVRRGETLEVRVLFACEPTDEASVRGRIDTALARRWQVVEVHADEVRDDEREHGERLVRS